MSRGEGKHSLALLWTRKKTTGLLRGKKEQFYILTDLIQLNQFEIDSSILLRAMPTIGD